MEYSQRQNNLISFIYQNLISRLKLQIDIPEIEGLNDLLEDFHRFSSQEIENFRPIIIEEFCENENLMDEYIALIDALVLYSDLRTEPVTPDIIEKIYDKLEILKKRDDFDISSTLNSVESSIIHALNAVDTLDLLKTWLGTIKKLNSQFDFDDISLKNWFEVKLIETLVSELQKDEKDKICDIMEYIHEMMEDGFQLIDIKTIAIDSALYHIADIKEKPNSSPAQYKNAICEILGVIQEIGVADSMKSRFEKYLEEYPPKKRKKHEGQAHEDEFVVNQNSYEFKDRIYEREVQTKNDTYKVRVVKARDKFSNCEVAIKLYRCNNIEIINKFLKEVDIMKFVSKLDGPFLKFYGSYLAQNFDEDLECNVHELGIVMEFCPVSLISKIQKMRINKQEFSEKEFENVAHLLIDGLSMLSESTMKIYHQDVKPQNIFFDSEGNLKIGDFNISTMDHLRDCTQTTGMNAVQGTVAYMAPEIIAVLNEGRGRYRKSKSDVYSFGVTLLQMYTKENQTYNESKQRNQREKKINDIKYPWLKNLIKVCLNEDYKLRPSFKDLFAYLPGMATIV